MIKRLTWIILGCATLMFTSLSCKSSVTGPTVTNAEVELFDGFVQSLDSGGFEWGGTVLNRSRFTITSAVQLELINPDNATFFTTVEHLVVVDPKSTKAFTITESATQVPLPVFSSIKDWNMKVRLVTWR